MRKRKAILAAAAAFLAAPTAALRTPSTSIATSSTAAAAASSQRTPNKKSRISSRSSQSAHAFSPPSLAVRTAIVFDPSFKAARKARGVVERARDAEYIVHADTHGKEIRAMLNGLVSTKQLEAAVRLLASYLSLPQEWDGNTEGLCSIVLNGCAEARRMDLGKVVIGAMRDANVPLGSLTFCILIKGHGRKGDVRRLERTYEAMNRAGVRPDLATLNALVDSYARNGRVVEAEAVLDEMAVHGVAPSPRTFNTLIKGYCHAGRMRDAFIVVRRLRTTLGPNAPNEVTYSTLIHGLVRQGELRRARQILFWMGNEANHLSPDAWAYTALIRGLLEAPAKSINRLNRGASTVMRRVPDPVEAEAAEARKLAAAEAGASAAIDEVLGLLNEMMDRGPRPNAATVSTAINGCFDLSNVTAARRVAKGIKNYAEALGDPHLSRASDNALIVGLCRPLYGTKGKQMTRNRAQLREALKLFVDGCAQVTSEQMRSAREYDGGYALAKNGGGLGGRQRRDLSQDYGGRSGGGGGVPLTCVRTCNALIAALAACGEVDSASRVLSAMDRGAASEPNAFTLCIMMKAHGDRKQLRKASNIWQRIIQRQWADTVGLNTWLRVCMANGEREAALQAFQMAKSELSIAAPADRVTFGTLIDGLTSDDTDGRSRGSNQLKADARRALQLWAEMRKKQIAPDDGIVGSLMTACRQHFGIEVALRLRVELLTMGWSAERLRSHDAKLLDYLPPLAEVMSSPTKWAALGVRLPYEAADIASEQSALVLDADCTNNDACDTEEAQTAAEALEGLENTVEPATVGQEIWERKGWNRVESGWRGFF